MNKDAVGVQIKNLSKTFPVYNNKSEVFYAVDHVSLSIEPGELVTLLGPSGCGKTTVLRMISGFLIPDSGEILIGDKDVSKLPPNKRNVGMMFQSYALFPHMSVYDNVAYGLKLKHLDKSEISSRVENMLSLMHIGEYAGRMPNELSGGQQQRVALARAVVTEPSVLLFDEPLSNLDAKLREYMREELRKIQQRVGITSVYVTHDQSEAMAISDKVVVMRAGVIQQHASAMEMYAKPESMFVSSFIGKANFVKPERVNGLGGGEADVVMFGQNYRVSAAKSCEGADACVCMVRPEDILVSADGPVTAKVLSKAYFGQYVQYFLEVEGQRLEMMTFSQAHAGIPEGSSIKIDFVKSSLRLLAADESVEQ